MGGFFGPNVRGLGGFIGGGASAFTLTATTTGAAETVTIERLTPSEDVDINWGDGTVETISADDEANQTHEYAAASSYQVRVAKADVITQLKLSNSKLSGLDTSQLQNATLTYFWVDNLGTAEESTVKSEHMSGWTPIIWRLYSMPSGTYDIQSTHMSGWTPTRWFLYSMPSGTYDIQSTHMSGWTPTRWFLYSMPSGNYVINAASDFDGWTGALGVYCYTLDDNTNGKLLEADVDNILWGLYQATKSRTREGGTIDVSGANEPPSGTYQAAASCPVDASTPGKEVAHELLNDGCGAIAAGETWDTVTINT